MCVGAKDESRKIPQAASPLCERPLYGAPVFRRVIAGARAPRPCQAPRQSRCCGFCDVAIASLRSQRQQR
jgi:hypothetical protein